MSSAPTAMTPSVDARLAELTAAMRLMIETQQTQSAMLLRLIELATPSDDESPLEQAMAEIAGALRDQTVVLERIDETMAAIGPDVEAGVLRGLAGALGVDAESVPSDPKDGG